MAAYRSLTRPFAKVFLGAMLTYQILYYCWERMRTDEVMEESAKELKHLEEQIKEYTDKKQEVPARRWF